MNYISYVLKRFFFGKTKDLFSEKRKTSNLILKRKDNSFIYFNYLNLIFYI